MPVTLTVARHTTLFHDGNGNSLFDNGEANFDAGEIGIFDPGETLYTRVTIKNTGDVNATNVIFSDNFAGSTLVNGTLNVSPIAYNDAFTAVGNTVLRVGTAGQTAVGGTGNLGTGPSISVSGNLLTNDIGNVAGDQITGFQVDAVSNGVSAGGGTFKVFADGSFTYVNEAGDTGTDTFTYTIRDAGMDGTYNTYDDLTSTAKVTITLTGEVWYVDSAAAA